MHACMPTHTAACFFFFSGSPSHISQESLPAASELEEQLRNGVLLCKLAAFFEPNSVKEKAIYDRDMAVFKVFFLI